MVVSLSVIPFAEDPPRAEVLITGLPAGVATVTVSRTSGGRVYEVRGAVRAAVSGSLTRVDFEIPLNIPVAYRAEMFDTDGVSLGFTNPGYLPDMVTGLMPAPDLFPGFDVFPSVEFIATGMKSARSWMHNPLNPSGAVAVSLVASAAQNLSRPYSGSVVRPKGRSVGMLVTDGPRGGYEGINLDVRCDTLEDADKVQALLGEESVPVICFRAGFDEHVRVPSPLFVGVLDIAEQAFNLRAGGTKTTQRIEGDEVAPPVPGLFIPLLTRADINAFYATRAAVNAGNATRLAVNRRYDLAGAAG